MQENRINIPQGIIPLSIKLNLTEDFVNICQLMNISFDEALQTYADHIKVYNQLFNEHKGVDAQAMHIFKKFQKSCISKQGLKVAVYSQLHVNPIKEILKLGRAKKGSECAEYESIIKQWYHTIMKAKDGDSN